MAETAAAVAYGEGVPCWVDAQLSDVEAGKRFYGGLFGWDFHEVPEAHDARGAHGRQGPSVGAFLGGEAVAGLAPKADGRLPTVWTVHFTTPDIAALVGRIRAAGGQVITPPTPVGTLGAAALATDPEGAVFALWQPGTRCGFGRRHLPGSFTWAQLYARDVNVAESFYGYVFHDALFGPGAAPDFGRAALSEVFPPEMPPHFLVHFAVTDLGEALGTVERLGGRVRALPFGASYGRVAVVTDDQGASFALLQRDWQGRTSAP
ncbi:hydrolase [Streptomyces ruber]|uniref:Hydrolase n=2 Tax=Streptomyces TaxID=1883 RepID=A0A918B6W5_9ACTN|nr:VOC family protein [Streptomyces ruber]GGQ38349.1 hydrolase [Streptomyces ruber]